MSQDDVVQIRVGNNIVGILGFKRTLAEITPEHIDKSDVEIGHELFKRLSKKNYIPESRREEYSKALLREFKKHLGLPFEEGSNKGLEIKVLGQGCLQCNRLEMDVMSVLAEFNVVADIEHIRDIKEIGKYGVLGLPALIINGKVKCVGNVPPRNQLKAWLIDAKG